MAPRGRAWPSGGVTDRSSAHSGCRWAPIRTAVASPCCWSWLVSSHASTRTSAHMQRECQPWGWSPGDPAVHPSPGAAVPRRAGPVKSDRSQSRLYQDVPGWASVGVHAHSLTATCGLRCHAGLATGPTRESGFDICELGSQGSCTASVSTWGSPCPSLTATRQLCFCSPQLCLSLMACTSPDGFDSPM